MPKERQIESDDAKKDGDEIFVTRPKASMRARWAERSFLIGLSAYAILAVLAHRYAYFEWDLFLARRIQSISIAGFGTLLESVSFLGNGWVPWVLVVAAGVVLMRLGRRMEGSLCMASVGMGWVVNRLLKLFIGRPRPTETLLNISGRFSQESFPSGHVVFFVEYFGFLFFLVYVLLKPGLLRRGLMIVLALPVALIGLSRVYLGALWPSDVAGAYLAGGIWLMLSIEVYRRIKARPSTNTSKSQENACRLR